MGRLSIMDRLKGNNITIRERNLLNKNKCPNCIYGNMKLMFSVLYVTLRCPKCGQGYDLSNQIINIGIDKNFIMENIRYKLEKE